MWLLLTLPFVVCGSPGHPLTESQKIEQLIAHIAGLNNAVFIRNGKEYDAKAAAEHLRKKWNYAKKEILTAQDFIEKIATKSSFSGQLYHIRLGEGRVVPAGEYLKQQLQRIDSPAKP